ncbi:response regulator [Donghicola sp. XS_ASV15]|uniref:response regulator n=1 Tax=Donghicola sp. XS_ASV15 TaxID=3241295 RepID=UPI00351175F3
MRVLLADDHELVAQTIAAYLRSEIHADVTVAPNVEEVLQMVAHQRRFDLILLDLNMPGMNHLEGLERVMAAAECARVAIISGYNGRIVAEEAVARGASGFLPKTIAPVSMISAIRLMAAGEVFLPFSSLIAAEVDIAAAPLTRRELQVLQGICEGKSNKEIARSHELQEVTVKLHVKTLSRKLGARNRTHAAMIARDRQLC